MAKAQAEKTASAQKITITFPDGSKEQFDRGVTCLEVAESISEGLARAATAAELDSEVVGLATKITKDAKFKVLTFKDEKGRDVFLHSAAHVFAHALLRLYKKAKIAIGPPIKEGFHYDFELDSFSPEDLLKVEGEMKKIVDERLEIVRSEMPKKEALKFFKDNPYKVEMIKELPGDKVTVYTQGEFSDLCRGPHVPTTSYIKAYKLTKISGAYWKGDSKNKQLQRVYGIAFPDKKDLKDYLTLLEEAAKRDHRKIGKDLELFSFHEEGPGFPFFLPKGMIVWNELLKFWREEHAKAGYVEVKTPAMLNKDLWIKSGHWENYRENMYTTTVEGEEFAIKPMNCPGGMIIFKEKLHSYRELPLRIGEIGHVHRHELSGVISGLFRVRAFHQDDAHIYCTKEQLESEIINIMRLFELFYKTFGLSYHIELSTRPEKYIGDLKNWEFAEKTMKELLKKEKISCKINEGDGAFYGPKFDFHLKDAIGRTWQCGTIQLDMNNPERFDLTYEGQDGKKHRPIMLHRVVYGSIERFFGVITEHFAGKFPLWLSPVQVSILTIADRHEKYAQEVADRLKSAGLRVEVDARAESISKKVREAQLQQINYILVVGDDEIKNKTVNVRTRKVDEKTGKNEVLGAKKVDSFIKDLLNEIEKKEIK